MGKARYKYRAWVRLWSGLVTLVLVSGIARADTHYVSPSGGHTPPFTNWPTAATNIQAAVDVASSNDTVLVTNGVYDTGGMVVSDMSNRVAVTKPLTLRSVGGPEVTRIVGHQVPGTTNGVGAVRCVYLGNGATLIGFRLTEGSTVVPGTFEKIHGGGVRCESHESLVSNCIINGNTAHRGGGAFRGTFVNCRLTGNWAVEGGGAYGANLSNCTLAWNTVLRDGGGAYACGLYNCTLAGNTAGLMGGGAFMGRLENCIAYHNSAQLSGNLSSGYVIYSCTDPFHSGTGNITNDPQFADLSSTNLRLLSASSCIDAGTNGTWMPALVDLDGLPRIINGTVDMGAYESPSPAITSLSPPSPPVGPVITWASFTGAQYAVYGSTNLLHGYDVLIEESIPAYPPENAFTDTVSGVSLRGYAVEFERMMSAE